MAVDNKSDHVGNHGGAYIDNDGMRKQFVTIDHDKKTKISSYDGEELSAIKQKLDNFVKERIEMVLLLPAVNIVGASGGKYDNLVKRTETEIVWNEKAVKEYLIENRTSFLPTLLWKRTVAQSNWHNPMWIDGDMDALRAGEWKKLTP